jgi:hypothetical protein
MGTIKQFVEFNKPDNEEPLCSFCGERRATGFWHASISEVFVCPECAVKVLPALSADAVLMDRIDGRTLEQVRGTLLKMEKAFYRAALISSLRAQGEKRH